MSGPRAVFQKVPFSVQAGCFKNRDNAEKLATQLKQAGFAGYVEKTGPAGGLYRVKVGRPGSREEATGLSARLERAGYETKICDGE
jgi:cell division septation protein DedD